LRKKIAATVKVFSARTMGKLEGSGLLSDLARDAQKWRERIGKKAARGRSGRELGRERARLIEPLFETDEVRAIGRLFGTEADDWRIELEATLLKDYVKLYNAGGRGARLKLRVSGSFELHSPFILEALEERANLISGISDSVYDRLRTVIAEEFYLNGKGPLEVAKLLEQEFSYLSRERAELIAHQETLAITEEAQQAVYEASGVPFKRWLTTLDGRERPDHFEAHGQIVAVEDPFIVGGEELQHPGDSSASLEQTARCRCDDIPIVTEDQLISDAHVWDGDNDPDEFSKERLAMLDEDEEQVAVAGGKMLPWAKHLPGGHDQSTHGRGGGEGASEGGTSSRYGGWKPGWSEKPDASRFITERNRSTRPGFLSPLEPSDIAQHDMLLSEDGKVGVGVSPEGDIQNLFNNGGPKGAATEAVLEAMNRGGRTLDAFAGHLPGYYAQFGFRETGRMRFNRDFAPSNWDYGKHDDPDVVFMALTDTGESDEQLRERVLDREQWSSHERATRYYEDFDQAKADARGTATRRSRGKERGSGVGGLPRQFDPRPGAGAGEPLAKHLPEQHDQSTHGRRGEGASQEGESRSEIARVSATRDRVAANLQAAETLRGLVDKEQSLFKGTPVGDQFLTALASGDVHEVEYWLETVDKSYSGTSPEIYEKVRGELDQVARVGMEYRAAQVAEMLPREKVSYGGKFKTGKAALDTAREREAGELSDRARERVFIIAENGELVFDSRETGSYHSAPAPQRDYGLGAVLTHNHPNSNTLSFADVTVARTNNFREIRAVGFDGGLFRMSPTRDWNDVINSAHLHEGSVRSEFSSAIENGQLDRDQAGARHWHEVWVRVAKDGHIRYEYDPKSR
jgi:hypothetical protein